MQTYSIMHCISRRWMIASLLAAAAVHTYATHGRQEVNGAIQWPALQPLLAENGTACRNVRFTA